MRKLFLAIGLAVSGLATAQIDTNRCVVITSGDEAPELKWFMYESDLDADADDRSQFYVGPKKQVRSDFEKLLVRLGRDFSTPDTVIVDGGVTRYCFDMTRDDHEENSILSYDEVYGIGEIVIYSYLKGSLNDFHNALHYK